MTATSYILGQNDKDWREYAVAYGGRAPQGAKRNYVMHELEYFTMVEGVRAYHHYLSYTPFTAITDNSGLHC